NFYFKLTERVKLKNKILLDNRVAFQVANLGDHIGHRREGEKIVAEVIVAADHLFFEVGAIQWRLAILAIGYLQGGKEVGDDAVGRIPLCAKLQRYRPDESAAEKITGHVHHEGLKA